MTSEEVGRKMDIKRQEISSSQQTIRDLEDRIVSREKERVSLSVCLYARMWAYDIWDTIYMCM